MSRMNQGSVRTWYALREFETRDITSRQYQQRHSRELSTGKAREISSAFVQGRQYFESALLADFSVRPLLLYYGVASLARGLTLFLNPSLREASLKQSHGLKTVEWDKTLSAGLTEVGLLRSKIVKGTFRELLTATNNRCYFRLNQASVNWYVGDSVPPVGTELTLNDIAARIPDLSDQYEAWTSITPAKAVLQSLTRDDPDSPYKIEISEIDSSKLERVFPISLFADRSVYKEQGKLVVSTNDASPTFFAQRWGPMDIGFVVICEPIPDKVYFSPLAAAYMMSFKLGMLCRYFPSTWIDVSRSTKGDSFYPLATRALDWVEDKFPLMIVDLLRGPYGFENS